MASSSVLPVLVDASPFEPRGESEHTSLGLDSWKWPAWVAALPQRPFHVETSADMLKLKTTALGGPDLCLPAEVRPPQERRSPSSLRPNSSLREQAKRFVQANFSESREGDSSMETLDTSTQLEMCPPVWPHPLQPHAFHRREHHLETHNGLEVVKDRILEEVPEAQVVIICGKRNDQATRAQLNVLPDPFLLPSPTEDVAATFLVVEDSQQCIQRACKLLVSSAGGAAPRLVVLLEDSLEASEAVEDHITTFMDNGAHDAIMCLSKSTDLSSLISTSFARAVSRKRQNSIFVQKIQRARSQCDQLFWEHVHECLEGFPEMNAVREVNGKVVQNLKLSRKLGQGSFGTVYAFQDVNNINRSGAAKVISKADVSSWDRVFAIWAEYHILQKLRSHPNVVEALGFLHGKKNIYIFMEMAGTLNLGSLLLQKQEQGLQLAQVHSLFRCICNGLAHCHELKVAHCDLDAAVVLNERP